MASEGPIDLIRLEGEGNSVIVRITGKHADPAATGTDALAAEILVESAFVRGSITTPITPDDLTEWQEALDTLDTGKGIGWREGKRTAEMLIDFDPEDDRPYVTITDRSTSLATVTLAVDLSDEWFDDAYRRLDEVLRAWPLTS